MAMAAYALIHYQSSYPTSSKSRQNVYGSTSSSPSPPVTTRHSQWSLPLHHPLGQLACPTGHQLSIPPEGSALPNQGWFHPAPDLWLPPAQSRIRWSSHCQFSAPAVPSLMSLEYLNYPLQPFVNPCINSGVAICPCELCWPLFV